MCDFRRLLREFVSVLTMWSTTMACSALNMSILQCALTIVGGDIPAASCLVFLAVGTAPQLGRLCLCCCIASCLLLSCGEFLVGSLSNLRGLHLLVDQGLNFALPNPGIIRISGRDRVIPTK